MEYDTNKVDDVVLALLWLTAFKDRWITRAWKGHDWDALARLYEEGYIDNPVNKNKSVVFTEEGEKRAEELFHKYFGKDKSHNE